MRISHGTAESLPPPDRSSDTVVAVHSVLMWPDLTASLREILLVLKPDGALVLSWHSSTAPSSASRRLGLTGYQVAEITEALEAAFDDVERRELVHSVADPQWRAMLDAAAKFHSEMSGSTPS
jgi:ubiquinone/menaquinone biosynthesis C-methylase UbiE